MKKIANLSTMTRLTLSAVVLCLSGAGLPLLALPVAVVLGLSFAADLIRMAR